MQSSRKPTEVVISVDSHVEEPMELWDRLPRSMRDMRPSLEALPDGGDLYTIEGSRISLPLQDDLTEDDWDCEYRRDPSGARSLARRSADMERDGVDAQVVFPEVGLGLGGGRGSREYHIRIARAYNDWVLEAFAPEPERFHPAALIPMDEVADAVAEAGRCIEMGFKTLFLPVAVPWRPYWHADYEPLWATAAEARVPLSFHVFSGNLWFGTDFAFLPFMPDERYESAKKMHAALGDVPERLSSTIVGMAAGMGPIIHLISSGALERHPDLRFAIVEADCGWLAWTLAAMDSMLEKRHLYLSRLPLKPSEYFARQGAVSITDDPVGIHNLALTGCDCIMWGNDYPHDEGTFPNSPRVIETIREAVDPEGFSKIVAENAARLYDFDLEFLASKRIPRAT